MHQSVLQFSPSSKNVQRMSPNSSTAYCMVYSCNCRSHTGQPLPAHAPSHPDINFPLNVKTLYAGLLWFSAQNRALLVRQNTQIVALRFHVSSYDGAIHLTLSRPKQDSRCTYNVHWGAFTKPQLPWESNKYYIFVCVCVCGYTAVGVCLSACSLIQHATRRFSGFTIFFNIS